MFMVKNLGALRPCRQSEDDFSKLPVDKALQIEVKQPRNLSSLRLYWGLVGVVVDNLPENSVYKTKGHVDHAIRLGTGHYEMLKTRDNIGRIVDHYVVKSIAFHKMKQEDFSEFLDRAIQFVCDVIIPGLDSDELRNAVHEMVAV